MGEAGVSSPEKGGILRVIVSEREANGALMVGTFVNLTGDG